MTEGPLASVDQVRDELRRLGYLEHGVDRFVLGGAGSTSPARASARAATRVGVLGGILDPHAYRKTRGEMHPIERFFNIGEASGHFPILRTDRIW